MRQEQQQRAQRWAPPPPRTSRSGIARPRANTLTAAPASSFPASYTETRSTSLSSDRPSVTYHAKRGHDGMDESAVTRASEYFLRKCEERNSISSSWQIDHRPHAARKSMKRPSPIRWNWFDWSLRYCCAVRMLWPSDSEMIQKRTATYEKYMKTPSTWMRKPVYRDLEFIDHPMTSQQVVARRPRHARSATSQPGRVAHHSTFTSPYSHHLLVPLQQMHRGS